MNDDWGCPRCETIRKVSLDELRLLSGLLEESDRQLRALESRDRARTAVCFCAFIVGLFALLFVHVLG